MRHFKTVAAHMKGFHGEIFFTTFVILLAVLLPSLDSRNAQGSIPSVAVDLYEQTLKQCPDAASACLEKAANDITARSGPEAALTVLAHFQETGTLPASVDDHQFAHEVGRQTAKTFGISAKSFLSCPTNFNYGCQHGFFEYVLGRTNSTKDASALICGEVENDPSYSNKFKFYCYHGLGHGVMMAAAYDLPAAIAVCDSLGSGTAREGCWQGVFMENVNAGMRGEAREGVFSEKDPLAPCNRVGERYHYQCYINHAGWLMTFFGNDVGKAAHACALAPDEAATSCLQSIGLMVTNPSWQKTLAGQVQKDEISAAWSLCEKFPKGYIEQCMIGGVDNILNFDESRTQRAEKFCGSAPQTLAAHCYRQVGVNLKNQTASTELVKQKCQELAQGARECLRGAGFP
jgi:hypothetical protein